MAAVAIQQYFGFGEKPSPIEETRQTTKALPGVWYTSPEMYALERRAIFTRRWILVTHQQRIPNAGDHVQTTVGEHPVSVVRSDQGEIAAHRGFALEIADALSVHVHLDRLGFVWVNLDTAEYPQVRWEEDHATTDSQPRLQNFDAGRFHFDHQYEIVGDFNWKTLADNYNECYHCPTGHPALNPTSDFSKYYVKPNRGAIEHWNTDKEEGGQALRHVTTFCYPSSHFTISPAFFYIGRWIPISPTQTRMEYEVYAPNEPTLLPEFHRMDAVFKVVLSEDKDLCNAAYRNVSAGVFSAGELHPLTELGPRYFQQMTREIVMEHYEREKRAGEKTWPARES